MKDGKVKIVKIYSILAIIIFIGAFIFGMLYIKNNSDFYVTYSEKSDIDYKVYIKENDYFKTKYLGKNAKYIASIIDYIDTEFKYELKFQGEKFKYNYIYKIMAEVKVKDKDDDNVYYEYAEELYSSKEIKNQDSIKINQKLNVDYNKYNSIISSFVTDYDLDRSESILKLSMYILTTDSNNTYLNEIDNTNVISLNIPLTTKTMSISMSSDLHNNEGTKILIHQDTTRRAFLIIAVIWAFIGLLIGIYTIFYYFKNRTPQVMYKNRIKRILSNYGDYIQEIDNNHKFGASVVYKLKRFEDLLEVRSTLSKPILMLHNGANTGTFFIIPANEFTIYVYGLRVIDIVAEKLNIASPNYDINNLDSETKEELKFTKEYIGSQIDEASKTMRMIKIDFDNVIEGNKEKDESIFEQLEKTTSYNVDEIKKALESNPKKKKSTTKKKTPTKKNNNKK